MSHKLRTEEELQAYVAKSVALRDGMKDNIGPLKMACDTQQARLAAAVGLEAQLAAVAGLIEASGDLTGQIAALGLQCGILGGLYYALGYDKEEIKAMLAGGDFLDLDNL